MDAPSKKCSNCRQDISAGSYKVHVTRCWRYTTYCEVCEMPVASDEWESHIEECHTPKLFPSCHQSVTQREARQSELRQLNIDMDGPSKKCSNCRQDISAGSYKVHVTRCWRYTTYCEVCEMPVASDEWESHIEECHTPKLFPSCHQSVTQREARQSELRQLNIDMDGPSKKCSNCRQDISAGSYKVHVTRCWRYTTFCEVCEMPVASDEWESHIEECHIPKQSVTPGEAEQCQTMDTPVEPLACVSTFSAEAGGLHFLWGGQTEKTISIGVYDVQTEQWTLTHTTGPPPPGLRAGGCVIITNNLYCFGGYDGSSLFNDLYKLNLETRQWSKVYPKSNLSEQPICKAGCSLAAVDKRTLVCFGGYGSEPTHVQPGSTFTRDYQIRGWTNEFHLFDTQEGVWSSPQVEGERPPPGSVFTFTKSDQDRAVLFGGNQSGYVKVNDLYLFNLRKMEVTKVEPAQGDQWPEARFNHSACCLNYGEDHPSVLVSGGVGKGDKVLRDMWILDVDSGKWTEGTKLVRGRCYHSITATSLGPGLTEVLMFGGRLECSGDPIAETTILRFERPLSVTGHPTEKWALVDVAHNNTRGSSQRLREKREKIRRATHHPSSESDWARALEQLLRAAKQRAQDAEQREQVTKRLLEEANHRCEDAEQRATEEFRQRQATEHLIGEANYRCEAAERRLGEALQTSQLTEQRAVDAERRVQEVVAENGRLQGDLQRSERRAQLAEQRADSLETQWVVHRREIQMTDRELGGGGWGMVKVAKFRGIEVAAKSLYEVIRSDYYRHLFIREMNMAARLRHPNLVQFIGATLEGEMIILTELMHTSLRRVLEQGGVSREHTISISVQVCQALNYLHLMQPDPVIHRDISSANVLLNPLPNNGWLAKVTDYGSVNTLRALQTENPGNPVYAAPEARIPSLQSTKMDIFSVGVLLIEMCSGQFPSDDGRERLLLTISDRGFSELISRCIDRERDNRPTAQELLSELKQL